MSRWEWAGIALAFLLAAGSYVVFLITLQAEFYNELMDMQKSIHSTIELEQRRDAAHETHINNWLRDQKVDIDDRIDAGEEYARWSCREILLLWRSTGINPAWTCPPPLELDEDN